jgi:hypothetical protein
MDYSKTGWLILSIYLTFLTIFLVWIIIRNRPLYFIKSAIEMAFFLFVMIPSIFILLSWDITLFQNERIIIIILLSALLIILFWDIFSTRNQFIILGIDWKLLVQNIDKELFKRNNSISTDSINVITNEELLNHFRIVPLLFEIGIILVINKDLVSRKEKIEIITLVKKSFNDAKLNNGGKGVIILLIIFLITFAYIFMR